MLQSPPNDKKNVDTPIKALTRQYWQTGEELLAKYPDALDAQDLDDFFLPWLACQGQSPLYDARPWITFAAARVIEKELHPDARVFEFGAGGSTLFFAQRVRELVTVEHDPHWLAATSARFRSRQDATWRAHLVPPQARARPVRLDVGDPEAYASTDERYAGMSFQAYAKTIERYADNAFDVVLIDGRARPACFKHAWAKTRTGGLIVLDNAERPQYGWVAEAAQTLGCELTWLWGPGPFNPYFWCTLVIRKVRERFALNDLDTKLERHLDFDGGTFVEAGANNGVTQSNTLYFEAVRGWRGLLVEPIAARMRDCQRLRPHARVEHAALVARDDPQRIATLRYANLMTLVKGGMHSPEEEDAHIKAGCEVQKIETYEFSAPTATLGGLLDKHGLGKIDLLSLDVEGYEATALRGLDFARHRPRYILVEARYRDEIEAVLSDHYQFIEMMSHHDALYGLKEDAAAPAAAPQLKTAAPAAAARAPECIACATPMVEYFAQVFDDRYGYPGHFSLHRCPACGQFQTLPLLEDQDLPALYGNYYPRREINIEALQRAAVDASDPAARRHMYFNGTHNQGHYAARPGMKVLDYGCGAGQSLLEAQKLGAEAYGLEADPNVQQVVDALGLRIHIGTIDDNPFPGVAFDLIVLNQVFEHIPAPATLLPKLEARLAPGGRVILSFPNAQSVFARHFGRDWINWHIPYHLHHFNRGSTRKFFARHGWDVVSLRTITPNLWTILQIRAANERTRMGLPHPMWTGQPAPEGDPIVDEPPTPFNRKLHDFALRAREGWPQKALAAFNRVADALGYGDSILVEIRKRRA